MCAVSSVPVTERKLRRALDAAKVAAGLDGTEERLLWLSLRHSYASMLATDLELPAPPSPGSSDTLTQGSA